MIKPCALLNSTAVFAHVRAGHLAIFLIGMLALITGCHEEPQDVQKHQQPGNAKLLQNQNLQEYAMTAKLRQQYIEAKTQQERVKARKALIADLKIRYGGIDAKVSGPPAYEHNSRFSRLMRDWSPIHCSLEDLKSIAGQPTAETEDFVEYKFDTGNVASAWQFKLSRRGTILAVEYIPGE